MQTLQTNTRTRKKNNLDPFLNCEEPLNTITTSKLNSLNIVHLPTEFFNIKSASAFVVICVLKSYENSTTGICNPSQKTLARASSLTVRTVASLLAKLKLWGFISWQFNKNSGKTCNYSFTKSSGTFFQVPVYLLHCKLNCRNKALLIAIKQNLIGGMCSCSLATLFQKSALTSKKGVLVGLKSLNALGLITLEKRRGFPSIIRMPILFENTNNQMKVENKSSALKISANTIPDTLAAQVMPDFFLKTPILNNRQGVAYITMRFNKWYAGKRLKNSSFNASFNLNDFLEYYKPNYSNNLNKNGAHQTEYFKNRNGSLLIKEDLIAKFEVWQSRAMFSVKKKKWWHFFLKK